MEQQMELTNELAIFFNIQPPVKIDREVKIARSFLPLSLSCDHYSC